MNPRLTPSAVAEMLRVLSFQLPWWLLLHALFTFYAAANWGKWAWAAVRVPGFLLALFLAVGMSQGEVVRELAKADGAAKEAPQAAPGAPEPAPGDAPAAAPPSPEAAGEAPRAP